MSDNELPQYKCVLCSRPGQWTVFHSTYRCPAAGTAYRNTDGSVTIVHRPAIDTALRTTGEEK